MIIRLNWLNIVITNCVSIVYDQEVELYSIVDYFAFTMFGREGPLDIICLCNEILLNTICIFSKISTVHLHDAYSNSYDRFWILRDI